MTKWPRMVVIVLATLGLVAGGLFQVGPANASHIGWPSPTGEPDRGVHTFCFDSAYPMDSAVVNRVRYSMDNNDGVEAQTNVGTQEYASCTASIDVRLQQRPIAPNYYGDAICLSELSNGRCDQFRVRIAVGEIKSDASDPGYEYRHTVCHEIGHTLGLWHYGNGDPLWDSPDYLLGIHTCMKSGIADNGANWTRSYGPHDSAAINNNW